MSLVLTLDQQTALSKIQSFLNDDAKQVFILKGAAGSGKTTLVKELIALLDEESKAFQVLAPTGRAAKVLREKTGFGSTIHRGIYNFDRLESKEINDKDESKKSYHYYFPLRPQTESKIVIVDEASMVSDVKTQHELYSFGTGQLLTDLLSYANLSLNSSKLIFIGDEAQLPPVSDNRSKALEESYFEERGFCVESATLKTIHRQLEDSSILLNANNIRKILQQPLKERSLFSMTTDSQVVGIDSEQIALDFVSRFPQPEVGMSVVISYSNAQAFYYNKAIREKLYDSQENIIPGDIVLINNNNYTSYAIELYNGDMATVVNVSPTTETRIAPVQIGDKKKKVKLTFRDICIRLPHYNQEIKCKIIDTLLNSTERDLSIEEMKALYIDFCIRFGEEQKMRKERNMSYHKEGSEEFKIRLRQDPYFNALKIKYGYAITCHKAQGGEWNTVYVDYSGRTGLFDDALRWCYTATTRAQNKLFGASFPKINGFQKLTITPIGKVSNVNDDFYHTASTYPTTPFHDEHTHIAKRLKYNEIVNKIEGTPYSIVSVVSLAYQEKYTFENNSQQISIDLFHKKSGVFNELGILQSDRDEVRILKELLNEPYYQFLPLSYNPTTDLFKALNQQMASLCSEIGVQITNIVEYPSNYYILYYLKTSGRFSYIQFYYRNTHGLTTANPKSDIGEDDILLQCLVNHLSQ